MFSTKDLAQLRKMKANPARTPQLKSPDGSMPEILKVSPLTFDDGTLNSRCVQLFGDNETLIGQLNMDVSIDGYEERIANIIVLLGGAWQRGCFNLRTPAANMFVHVETLANPHCRHRLGVRKRLDDSFAIVWEQVLCGAFCIALA